MLMALKVKEVLAVAVRQQAQTELLEQPTLAAVAEAVK
jgi:hypothetical protein